MIKGSNRDTPILRIILSVIVILLSRAITLAQTSTYYIQFTDKKNNSCSIDKPEAFLSPKAIERRRLQHIAIKEDDLPVSVPYLLRVSAICQIVYTLKWSNGVVISSDASAVERLRQLPFVSDIKKINSSGPSTRNKALDNGYTKQQNATADSTYYGSATRQTTMIHLDQLHARGYWGDGVLIGMMDAGFLRADTNPFFYNTFHNGRMVYSQNFVYGGSDVYSSPHADPHGAETFSCIAANRPHEMVGTAPNASFALFHTEDARSETILEEYNWAAAAEVADSLGADVLSTSLGYTTFDRSDTADNHSYADMTGHSTPIAKAVNKAASKGILVINSAGNEGANTWHYIATPGDADSGVTAGAVTPGALVANFSSRGPNSSGQVKPDVCVQGAPAAIVSPDGFTGSANGTSFSCPITAGAFACLRQAFPSAPAMAIVDAVRQSCHLYQTPNADYGYGIPDFGDAYDRLKILYPQDTLLIISTDKAFPNPFSTYIRIAVSDQREDSVYTAELYDISGQKVWSGTYHMPTFSYTLPPSNIWSMDTPDNLAAGEYILAVNKTRKYRMIKK